MEFSLRATPVALIFWLFTALWIAEFLVFRSPPKAVAPRRTSSFALLVVAICFSFAMTGTLYHFKLGNLPRRVVGVVRGAGLVVYGLGVLLRLWSARSLATSFSRHLQAREDQKLVSHGPYARLRHPLYVGLLMAATGLNALMANVIGTAAALLVVGGTIRLRTLEEEAMMEDVIGPRYRDWMSTRYRWIPFLF